MRIALDGYLQTKRKSISLWILLILLLIRLTDSFPEERIWGEYGFYYFTFISLAFLIFVIWLNKENFQLLNIDKPFLWLFLVTIILLFWYFHSSWLGILLGASVVYLFFLVRTHKFDLGKHDANGKLSTFVYLAIGIIPIFVIGVLSNAFSNVQAFLQVGIEDVTWIITTRLWYAVFEELLFRGMLWMALKNFQITDKNILIIQALFFWIAHLGKVSWLSFWLSVPLVSVWLGFLVMRSKSLTSSTVTHLAYNLTIYLMKN